MKMRFSEEIEEFVNKYDSFHDFWRLSPKNLDVYKGHNLKNYFAEQQMNRLILFIDLLLTLRSNTIIYCIPK